MLTLPELGFVFAFCIFAVGLSAVMFRKNILIMLLGVELMLNASNLALISASRIVQGVDGQILAFFVMAIAACEAAVGLAMVIAIYRAKSRLESDELRLLRG